MLLPRINLYTHIFPKEEGCSFKINNLLTNDNFIDPCYEMYKLILGPDNLFLTIAIWSLWFLTGIVYYGIIISSLSIIGGLEQCYDKNTGQQTNLSNGSEVPTNTESPCNQLDPSDYEYFIWNTAVAFPSIFIAVFIIDTVGRSF